MKFYNKCLLVFLGCFYWFYVSGCQVPAADKASEALNGSSRFIAFEDPVFKNYLLTSLFKRERGEISEAEAAQIQILRCAYREELGCITNLSGIEHFKGLRVLDLQNQAVKRLDLSANSQLEVLNLGGNISLDSVVLPDLSKSLCRFDIEGCVSLCLVVFNKTPALQHLNLKNCMNYKEPLDLTEMPKLRSLNLYGVPMADLDIESNPCLEFLNLNGRSRSIWVNLSVAQKEAFLACDKPHWLYNAGTVRWTFVDE